MRSMVWISLTALFFALPAQASDSWLCMEKAENKSIPWTIKVVGDTLVYNDGKAHSKIIENNSDHIISYSAFLSDVKRYPNNSAPVVVAEPSVSYIVIEKASGRVTKLSSVMITVMTNMFGSLPAPDVKTEQCQPN